MNPMRRVIDALFYKFFLAGLNFAVSILTARFLGAAGRGYLTVTINNVSAYSPVFGAFSEYIPYGINKQKHSPQIVFSTALWYCGLLTGVLFIAALVLTPWMLHGFGPFSQKDTLTAWVAGLVAPFALFHVYVTRLIWGVNELEWLNRLNTVQAFMFIPLLVLGIVFRHHGYDLTYYAIIAWLVSYILTSIIAGIVAVKKANVKLIPRVDRSIRREIFDFGLKLAGSRLLNQANYRIDVYMVFFLLGAAHTGVYSIAVTVAEILLFVSGSIQQVVLTRISSLNVDDSTQLTARTFRHTAVVILFSYVGMLITMPYLIRLAYGKEFTGAITYFFILVTGVALTGMASNLTTFFTNQLGRPAVNSYLEAISIVVNVAMSFLLLPHFGEEGAAWAKLCANVSMFIFSIGYFGYVTKYPIYKLFYLQPDEIDQYKSLFGKIKARLIRKTTTK
jgi:O-antigen/teichoic acid export membrane protein